MKVVGGGGGGFRIRIPDADLFFLGGVGGGGDPEHQPKRRLEICFGRGLKF